MLEFAGNKGCVFSFNSKNGTNVTKRAESEKRKVVLWRSKVRTNCNSSERL